jgi:hypothetical protein
MRLDVPVYVRVGAGVGILGAVLLAVAQSLVALAALVLLGLVALLAGLAMAKWLPRAWYGRQVEAGWRSGAIACGLALTGLLVSIGLAGARSIAVLATRSHVLGINLGPMVRALGILGWIGASLVLMLCAGILGTGIATAASLLGSWGKDRRAIEIVDRAREAGQRSSRALGGGGPSLPDSYGPALGSGLLPDPTFTWPPAPAAGAGANPAAGERPVPPIPEARTERPSRRPTDDENWLC